MYTSHNFSSLFWLGSGYSLKLISPLTAGWRGFLSILLALAKTPLVVDEIDFKRKQKKTMIKKKQNVYIMYSEWVLWIIRKSEKTWQTQNFSYTSVWMKVGLFAFIWQPTVAHTFTYITVFNILYLPPNIYMTFCLYIPTFFN